MILDEKAIEKILEESMPSNRWYPKISDIKSVAHAQARAISKDIDRILKQPDPYEIARDLKSYWLQLEAELERA